MSTNLNLIRVFIEIVNAGNLSSAARSLGVSRAQVSKDLKQLELQMGAALIERTTRRSHVTESGRVLYQHGLRMLDEVDSAHAAISSLRAEARGYVHLSLPTGLADIFLSQKLASFQSLYPGIGLRTSLLNRGPLMPEQDIDVAVMIADQAPTEYVVSESFEVEWGLYASSEYLSSAAAPDIPEDLKDASFICPPNYVDRRRRVSLRLSGDQGSRTVSVAPRVVSNHFPHLRTSMLGGLGISLLPTYMVASDLEVHAVEKVLPNWRPEGFGSRAFIMRGTNRSPLFAETVLRDFLIEALSDQSLGLKKLS